MESDLNKMHLMGGKWCTMNEFTHLHGLENNFYLFVFVHQLFMSFQDVSLRFEHTADAFDGKMLLRVDLLDGHGSRVNIDTDLYRAIEFWRVGTRNIRTNINFMAESLTNGCDFLGVFGKEEIFKNMRMDEQRKKMFLDAENLAGRICLTNQFQDLNGSEASSKRSAL